MTDSTLSLRYASVCSGIDAVTVAWQPLGLYPLWFSEIDPFANAVLAYHYPQVPNLGDMTRLASQVRRGTLCAPDILVGGTPCQSFSVAGMRRGLADPRGALTLQYAELADAIDHARVTHDQPAAVLVWENVPGVLSDRANAFGCFLGAISGEDRELHAAGETWTNAGCIYGPQRTVAWRVLDAQYFGVAQRRKRVFVVASARDDFDSGAVLFESDSVRRDSSPSPQLRENTPQVAASGATGSGRGADNTTGNDAQAASSVGFGGGNTRGPIDVAACLTGGGPKNDFETETFSMQSLTGTVSHPLTGATSVIEDGNGRGVPIVASHYQLKRGGGSTCYALAPVAFAQNSRGALRLEGGLGQRFGALSAGGGKPGQGVPMIASVALRGRPQGISAELGGDIAYAICASTGGGKQPHVLFPSLESHFQCVPVSEAGRRRAGRALWRVRRLMPLECERLQGLPDNYTLVPYRGKPAADGPRYKAIGNSMAVPCITWIGNRVMRVLKSTPQSVDGSPRANTDRHR